MCCTFQQSIWRGLGVEQSPTVNADFIKQVYGCVTQCAPYYPIIRFRGTPASAAGLLCGGKSKGNGDDRAGEGGPGFRGGFRIRAQ
jgi:hypothetical protein